jgi:hypothetical protein
MDEKLQASLKERTEKIELLERFAQFLEDEGYLDADWKNEPPLAIDQFMKIEDEFNR